MEGQLERVRAALADRYALKRELGSGGMATVYVASDLKHHREVAVKVLDPELAAAIGSERFLREIEIAANLTHPHILPLFDSGEADGFLYFVMPYVEGESLSARLTREKQLPVDDAVRITREVAEALAYAHERGLVHRDVKPANILLEAGQAVLADFGVAQAATGTNQERLTRTGVSVGTPTYMSPEQVTGEGGLDGRSDQYALGCALYEMLAGRPPFTGPTAESVRRQHLVAAPTPVTQIRPSVSPEVADVVERSLAKSPADRFTTMSDLAAALSGVQPATRHQKKSRARLAAAGLGVVSVIAGLAVGYLTLAGNRAVEAGSRVWVLPAEFGGSADLESRRIARDLVIAELEQSSTFTLLTRLDIERGLELAGRADTSTVGPELALELAERGGVGVVLTGELDQLGNTFSVRLRVLGVEDGGRLLVGSTGAAQGEDQLITAVGDAARELRSRLGEERIDLKADRQLREVMTPSLPAYRKYREARSPAGLSSRERIALLHDAMQLDTGFAAAMSEVSFYYANIGDYDSAMVYLERALERPDRLTEAQMLSTRVGRANARGDIPEAYRLQNELVERYGVGHNNLGLYLDRLGRDEEAAEYFRTRRRPFGPGEFETANQIHRLVRLGHIDEAEALVAQNPGFGIWHREELLAGRGRWGEFLAYVSDRASDVTLSIPRRTNYLHSRANGLAARGAIAASRRALKTAIELEPGRGDERYLEGSRLLLALASEGGVPPLAGTLEADSSTAGLLFRSISAALQGDASAARQLLRRVEARRPEAYAPYATAFLMAEAGMAWSAGDWSRIPELVGEAASGFWPHYPRGNLRNPRLIQWMVGDAFERLNEPDSAVVYFEMVAGPRWELGRVGLVVSFAHRRLARLNTVLGRDERAREHWQAFLDTFVTPDPEFAPLVEEARRAVRGR